MSSNLFRKGRPIVPLLPHAPPHTPEFPESGTGRDASNGGYGTDDTLKIIQILEENGIICCLVGFSALIFYGAVKLRPDWEICVPTTSVEKAKQLLLSKPFSETYELVEPWPRLHQSLIQTYSRFKIRDVHHYFILVPSVDVHLDCDPANIVRSKRGLPYPSLPAFVQSCLDRRSTLELVDVVDGTDVSEQWGEENLQLDGTNDVEWARDVNRRGMEFEGGRLAAAAPFAPYVPRSRRVQWQEAVRTKDERMDWGTPREIFATQYRVKGKPNSWEVLSEAY